MKILLLALCITGIFAAPKGLPVFHISGSSRASVPEMKVTFENDETHEMILEPFSNSACNFIGTLKNVPSSVAVTGCLENPGDKMHITLMSEHNRNSPMYELDYDGNVSTLENPFQHQNQEDRSGKYPLKNRDAGSNKCDTYEKHEDEMEDEEIDLSQELQATLSADAAMTWPDERYAYAKLCYDRTLKNQLELDGTNFNTWAADVMTHVQAHYRHPSLPLKIQFKYDLDESIFENRDMPTTDFLEAWSEIGQKDADPKIDLYIAFGKDPVMHGTVGLAWTGGACKNYHKTSFNEYRRTPAQTGMVVAHEVGHNFGMTHDFDEKHGGKGNAKCDGKGIMSYGTPPAEWSKCSVEDFTGYYNSKNWGETCLKNWGPYCGDKCPGVTCTITDGSGNRFDTWCQHADAQWSGGCNGQYKNYFHDACQKTCGLCVEEEYTTEKPTTIPTTEATTPKPTTPKPTTPKPTTPKPTTAKPITESPSDCENDYCETQAAKGRCNKGWMKLRCKKACGLC